MRELLMCFMCGPLCYLLVTHIALCVDDGHGGIPEEEAEDEPK